MGAGVGTSGVVLLPLLGRIAFGTVEYRLSRIESVFESESGFECASYLGAPCVFNLVFAVNHLALTVLLLSFVCFSRFRFAVYT